MSTSIASIVPLNVQLNNKNNLQTIPLAVILKLTATLKKSIFSRKFYQEISDKVLSKPSTIDANLYFICYFTLMVSSILNNKPRIKHFLSTQRYHFLQLVNRASSRLLNVDLKSSGNKVVSSTFNAPRPEFKESSRKSNLAVHLKAISTYLADIRIFNRLFDSIKYMPWVIDEFTAFTNPEHAAPKLDRFINLLQSLNCLVLELFENAGWLTDHNWVGTNDNAYWCIETYIWCCRVWGLYIGLEVVELFRRPRKWDAAWKITLFKQIVQLPLVVHWSLYDGCLTPFWVGLFGSGASWHNFKDIWKSIDLS